MEKIEFFKQLCSIYSVTITMTKFITTTNMNKNMKKTITNMKKNDTNMNKSVAPLGKRGKRTEERKQDAKQDGFIGDYGESGTMVWTDNEHSYRHNMRMLKLKNEKSEMGYRAIYDISDDEEDCTSQSEGCGAQSEENRIANAAAQVSDLDYTGETKVNAQTTNTSVKKEQRKKNLVDASLLGFSHRTERVVSGCDILESKEKTEVLLNKTQMCKHISRPGGCKFETKCRFAHSKEELQVIRCAFGANCRVRDCKFCKASKLAEEARNNREVPAETTEVQPKIITTENQPSAEYNKTKTKLCTFYEEKGYCSRKLCVFAHGLQELRCGYGSSCCNKSCTRKHPEKPSVVEPVVQPKRMYHDVIEETGEIIVLLPKHLIRTSFKGQLNYLGAILKPKPIMPARQSKPVKQTVERPQVVPVVVVQEVFPEEKFERPVDVEEEKPINGPLFDDDFGIEEPPKIEDAVVAVKNLPKKKKLFKRDQKPVEHVKKVVEKPVEEKKPKKEKKIVIELSHSCDGAWDD
jgi:hypothetical protein